MIQSNIKVNKTGRYFLSQKPNANIQEVWIVCHGYGQLANKFLNWFNPVFSKNILVVAPEGLNRFYQVGFHGNVGASWMTKEDRKIDIEDYVTFLEQIYNKIKSQVHKKAFFHVLGFSQGTATACRWIAMSKSKVDFLTLWAGTLPEDIDYSSKKDLFNKLALKVIIGSQDEFYTELLIQKQLDMLQSLNLDHLIIRFKGRHEIPEKPLTDLKQKIQQEIIDKTTPK